MEKENFILKKIRYYQATVADYETFWNEKIKESQSEISDDTKKLKKHNDDLNKDFEIVPVEKDYFIYGRNFKRSCNIQQI